MIVSGRSVRHASRPRRYALTDLNVTLADAPIATLGQAVIDLLADAKAEDVISIGLEGKSSIADIMVIASGRSARHVAAIAERLREGFKSGGAGPVAIEGLPLADWVLIDAGAIIVHVFRPEVRAFYNLEKMWLSDRPGDDADAAKIA